MNHIRHFLALLLSLGLLAGVLPAPALAAGHTHVWSTEWNFNSLAHWHDCTAAGCDLSSDDYAQKQGYAPHTFGGWTVTKAATDTVAGTQECICTACGYINRQVIPATQPTAKSYTLDLRNGPVTLSGDEFSAFSNTLAGGLERYDPSPMSLIGEPVGYYFDLDGDGRNDLDERFTAFAPVTEPPGPRAASFSASIFHSAPVYTWPLSEEVQARYLANGSPFYATLTILMPEPLPATAQQFNLMPRQYYYQPALWAIEKGIDPGESDTEFGAGKTSTRRDTILYLWRAMGSETPVITEVPFQDLDAGDDCYQAVLWAYEHGYTIGTSETAFSPDMALTRAQVVTFLHRVLDTPAASSSENPFRDVKAGDYFYDAVLWAVEQNVTTGTSATEFTPSRTCTKAETLTFLYRTLVKN